MLSLFYQFLDTFAFLVLASTGLAVIFGMMGVINLAHGEFIMVGAYATAFSAAAGVPLILAIGVGALAAGIFGVILERLVIRHLYHRLLDSIVATFAISLIVTQGTLIILGPTAPSIGTPLGSVTFGGQSFSVYRLVLAGTAIGLLALMYWFFMYTRYGVYARATIQNPSMAAALGVHTRRLYMVTFGFGAALAGLTGGLYAPTMALEPLIGTDFIVPAFVTVVVGGGDILIGLPPAAALLAVIQSSLTAWQGQLIGQVGLLIAVILVIRVLPQGISGLLRGRNV
jgi:urea ABC transporter permease protein UrtB